MTRTLILILMLILALLLTACVDGHPYEPCPDVTIYMSVDTVSVLGADSVIQGCP